MYKKKKNKKESRVTCPPRRKLARIYPAIVSKRSETRWRHLLYKLIIFCFLCTTKNNANDQPIVTCFFARPYTPRTLPGNSLWWETGTDYHNFRWFTQCELSVAQTFRPERITQCLFGSSIENCYQTLCVSGSHTTGRGTRKILLREHHTQPGECHTPLSERIAFSVDWLADYFWLPTDFISELRFKPTINTYRATPSLHGAYMLNECTACIAELYLPIDHTTWNLHTGEKIRTGGTNADDAGYFNAIPIDRSDLNPNARSFFAGYAPLVPATIINPLCNAKFAPCALGKTALNCAYFTFGIYAHPELYILYGFNGILSVPAGTRPTGEYLFEPLVGDGHYWRYGLEAYAQFHLFDDPCRNAWGLMTFDTTFTSCAPSHQKRTFDLNNSPGSRYMLIQKPNALIPEYNYLANISTLDLKAHIRILFEISATLTYATAKTNWNFGYRFWARSDDCLKIIDPCQFPNNTWALKGDSYVYGFAIPPGTDQAGTPNRIPTSERKATIEAGTNIPRQGSTNPTILAAARRNPNIDNPAPATTSGGQPLAASPSDLTIANQINASNPAELLSFNDLNLKSACSTGMLHTLFTIVDTQLNCPSAGEARRSLKSVDWHLYFRGEIDCGKASTSNPPACFDQCINIAPSQWEVALGLYVDF